MTAFFFGKPDVLKMDEKRDVGGLIKALKYKDPEVREKAVDCLRNLACSRLRAGLSLGEIIKYDLVRALLPMLEDEAKGVRFEAKKFYYEVLKRLGEAHERAVPDYLVRVARETSTKDSFQVYRIRLECAVSAEFAYGKVRRGFCSVCGVQWDQSMMEALFSPPFIGGFVKKGTTQPAGGCSECGNYYCAKCAKYTPGVVLNTFSVRCPKCNDNLTFHVAEEEDYEIRGRFESSVSIRGINKVYSFKLEMNKDVEGLIEALKHKDDDIREDAAEALGQIRDPKAVEPLIHALKDEHSKVRWKVAYALRDIGDAKALEPLTQALKDEDHFVRSAVVTALGKIGGAEAVEPLIQAMKDMDKDVRWDAAIALSARARAGMIKDARMVEPLIQALKNKYEYAYVRRTAAEALGEIGDEKAKEALTQALKDEDLDVQQAAKKALENIKAKKS